MEGGVCTVGVNGPHQVTSWYVNVQHTNPDLDHACVASTVLHGVWVHTEFPFCRAIRALCILRKLPKHYVTKSIRHKWLNTYRNTQNMCLLKVLMNCHKLLSNTLETIRHFNISLDEASLFPWTYIFTWEKSFLGFHFCKMILKYDSQGKERGWKTSDWRYMELSEAIFHHTFEWTCTKSRPFLFKFWWTWDNNEKTAGLISSFPFPRLYFLTLYEGESLGTRLFLTWQQRNNSWRQTSLFPW